jgi:dihydrofolate reductase
MGTIIAAEYVALDGVIEAPAWTGPYFNDDLAKLQADLLFASDALLLGRVTYEGFAAAWPRMEESEGEFAVRMNQLPKHVASRTLSTMEWNATPLGPDVVAAVTELKQSDRNLLIYGSGELVNLLLRHDLIDQYRLMIFPVVVGHGKRLFDEGQDTKALRPVATTMTTTGVLVADYEPA